MTNELLAPWHNLELGQSVNGTICPFCGGGEHRDKSFSVTRKQDGVLVYMCHRNKCNRAGVVHPDGTNLLKVHTKTKEHKIFGDPTVPLTEEHLKFFEGNYGLSAKEIGAARFLYVPNRDAVWQPVYAPDRHFRGVIIRKYSEKRIWSYKTPQCAREPLLAWYPGPVHRIPEDVVIVEDMLSAIKLSRYHMAVALNGTSMSNEAIMEIYRNSATQYLCLDKDATAQAIKLQQRWKSLLNITVIPCNKDPKYWGDPQLESLDEAKVPF